MLKSGVNIRSKVTTGALVRLLSLLTMNVFKLRMHDSPLNI